MYKLDFIIKFQLLDYFIIVKSTFGDILPLCAEEVEESIVTLSNNISK